MLELKINGAIDFPSAHTFWNNSPRLIENGRDISPEDVYRDPATVMQLRYMAGELMTSAFLDYEDRLPTRDDVEEEAYIAGDNLNLANGEGYQITDDLYIDYLFAIKLYGNVRGCLALYNRAEDSYTYWLLY